MSNRKAIWAHCYCKIQGSTGGNDDKYYRGHFSFSVDVIRHGLRFASPNDNF
jgi:hypothetical protein